MLIPLPRFPELVSQRLCFRIREEQAVRNVVPSFHRQILLAERINPADPTQNRPNQIVFGLALARRLAERQFTERPAEIGVQQIDSCVVKREPFGRAPYSFGQEIAREQNSLNNQSDVSHATY